MKVTLCIYSECTVNIARLLSINCKDCQSRIKLYIRFDISNSYFYISNNVVYNLWNYNLYFHTFPFFVISLNIYHKEVDYCSLFCSAQNLYRIWLLLLSIDSLFYYIIYAWYRVYLPHVLFTLYCIFLCL
jgi:hypothetical protein